LEKDLLAVLNAYIQQREGAGLSRADAIKVAMHDVQESIQNKVELSEAGVLQWDEQSRLTIASKKVTDRLIPKEVRK
jgi:hypothetical protein